jgi:hypothetical protein
MPLALKLHKICIRLDKICRAALSLTRTAPALTRTVVRSIFQTGSMRIDAPNLTRELVYYRVQFTNASLNENVSYFVRLQNATVIINRAGHVRRGDRSKQTFSQINVLIK